MHRASRHSLSIALSLVIAGCTPTFDRCRIPGTAGCPGTSDAAVADAAADSGGADAFRPEDAAVDASGGDAGGDAGPAGCPAETTVPLFATDFAGVTIDRFTVSGDSSARWAIAAGELVQSVASARGSQALLTEVTEPDIRVIARMRRTAEGGGGALELAVRASSVDSYHCNWEPATGEFEIQRDTMTLALGALRVDIASLPGYDPDAPITMDLTVEGSVLRCCVRELPGATLTVVDTALPTGSPGARTFRLAAAYDSLAIHPAR